MRGRIGALAAMDEAGMKTLQRRRFFSVADKIRGRFARYQSRPGKRCKSRHARVGGNPEPAKLLGSRLRGSDDKWLFQNILNKQVVRTTTANGG